MKKKIIATFVSAMMLATVLAGCGAATEPPVMENNPVMRLIQRLPAHFQTQVKNRAARRVKQVLYAKPPHHKSKIDI